MIKIKNLKLDEAQRQIIGDVSVSSSQVSSGSVVIPLILSGLAPSSIPMIILGAVVTLGFWLFAVLIVKKKGKKK